MRSLRGGLFLAILAGCGASGGKVKGPAATSDFKAGVKVKITDGGQIYDALNTTDCIKWPSKDVKKRAGRDGWHDFAPNSGLEGTVVAALDHCDHQTLVVLVAVGDYVVPVTSKGVEVPRKGGDKVVAPEPSPDYGYGGSIYGYDDGYGYGGYGYGGGGTMTNGIGSFIVGDVVAISDASLAIGDINQNDCLTWPSDDVKTRGGTTEWNGYVPSNGEIGVVLGVSTHCSTGAEILILEMDSGYVVPIESAGVTAP